MHRRDRIRAGLAAAVLAGLTLSGCASEEEPEVEQVATAFEDPSGDAEARCALLAPETLAALEESEPCVEAIEQLSLEGGEVRSVEVWGRDAQVRLAGDTLFLTRTHAGWRIVAAACQPNGEGPYDCEVEA